MKITLISLGILLIGGLNMNAQTALEARFGAASIQQAQGTEKLEFLQFQNLNGYAVQDLSDSKDISEFPDALEIEAITTEAPPLNESIQNGSIELFAYNFPMAQGSNLYYRIGNSGKILVIYAASTVREMFNEQQNGDSE